MSLQSHEKGDTIFKVGDRGDKPLGLKHIETELEESWVRQEAFSLICFGSLRYYIILLGSVSVQVSPEKKPVACTCLHHAATFLVVAQLASGIGASEHSFEYMLDLSLVTPALSAIKNSAQAIQTQVVQLA